MDNEVRWQAIGKVSGKTLLLVAHTYEVDEGEEQSESSRLAMRQRGRVKSTIAHSIRVVTDMSWHGTPR